MKSKERKNREDVKRVGAGGVFGKWKTAMTYDNDPEVKLNPGRFADRKGEGKKVVTNPFPKKSGVYEMRIVPKGCKEKDGIVMYLGKAGGDNIKSTLKDRIDQYMQNGSHKSDFYNAVLKGKCKVQFRAAPAGMKTRATTGEEKAKALESYFLKKFDYAANKVENGNKRYKELTIKVDGKKMYFDEFLVKNGYPEDKMDQIRSQAAKKYASRKVKEIDETERANPARCARTKKCARPPTTSSKSSKIGSGHPKKKDNTLDMRYKVNKDAMAKKKKKSARPSSKSSASSHSSSPYRPSSNSSSYGMTDYGWSRMGSYGGYNVPLKNGGTPDMRFRVCKDLFG